MPPSASEKIRGRFSESRGGPRTGAPGAHARGEKLQDNAVGTASRKHTSRIEGQKAEFSERGCPQKQRVLAACPRIREV